MIWTRNGKHLTYNIKKEFKYHNKCKKCQAFKKLYDIHDSLGENMMEHHFFEHNYKIPEHGDRKVHDKVQCPDCGRIMKNISFSGWCQGYVCPKCMFIWDLVRINEAEEHWSKPRCYNKRRRR